MKKRVYIAGPLNNGGENFNGQAANKAVAMRAAVELIKAGYAPLCPHLTCDIDPAGVLPHQTWLDVDLAWVSVSDAVLRLPGDSKGADMEVAFAMKCKIPVFDHIDSLVKNLPPA